MRKIGLPVPMRVSPVLAFAFREVSP